MELCIPQSTCLHNAVGSLGLDLEVGSLGVVEVLVEELEIVSSLRRELEKRKHTSFAGFAISLKGTGAAMMGEEMDGEV